MIDEIKNIARQHLASEGANLSLRAVARDPRRRVFRDTTGTSRAATTCSPP
jgi:hypothetical protein